MKFDHAVIVVPELQCAMDNFKALGFEVQRGGANGPTHNALIYFRDGTYIELITPVRRSARIVFRGLYATGLLGFVAGRQAGIMTRFLMWFGAPAGLRDWCVRCDSLDGTIEKLREQGVETTDAQCFSRKRPDGEVAKWRLAGPVDSRLPFLIEDITPTEIRVPFEGNCNHPNGVTGISAVVVHAGLDPVWLVLGNVSIRTVVGAYNPLALELSSRGDAKGPLARDKTFGAQITIT